jgi:hypothetical protein
MWKVLLGPPESFTTKVMSYFSATVCKEELGGKSIGLSEAADIRAVRIIVSLVPGSF